MKITVLGAAGKMAPGVIRDLAESPEVTEIRLADLEKSGDTLKDRVKNWGNGKATTVYVDLNDHNALQETIRGSAALANCTISCRPGSGLHGTHQYWRTHNCTPRLSPGSHRSAAAI